MKNKYLLLFLKILPKNFISRIAGKLANIKFPTSILNLFIKFYIKVYKIDLKEVEPQKFKNFNQFFTRKLKKESRPISHKDIVSPVDGIIGEFGEIKDNTLIQAKGINYKLENLLINPTYIDIFKNGYFITFYLSPRHYHRIHSPVDGKIKESFYIPGTLYPVNKLGVNNVLNLFTLNERIITLIYNNKLGNVGVVKIGAIIVGKIKVNYDKSIESNKRIRKEIYKKYKEIPIKKGEELGRFEIGSTVILLFEKNLLQSYNFLLEKDKEIKFGESLVS